MGLPYLLLRIQTELSWEYLFNPITRPPEPDADTGGEPESMDKLSCCCCCHRRRRRRPCCSCTQLSACRVCVCDAVGSLLLLLSEERRECGLTRNPFATTVSQDKESQQAMLLLLCIMFVRFDSQLKRSGTRRAVLPLATAKLCLCLPVPSGRVRVHAAVWCEAL